MELFFLLYFLYIFFCKVSFSSFRTLIDLYMYIDSPIHKYIYVYFVFFFVFYVSRTFKSKLNLGNLPYYSYFYFFF